MRAWAEWAAAGSQMGPAAGGSRRLRWPRRDAGTTTSARERGTGERGATVRGAAPAGSRPGIVALMPTCRRWGHWPLPPVNATRANRGPRGGGTGGKQAMPSTHRIAARRPRGPRRDAGATGHKARERDTGERRDAGAGTAAATGSRLRRPRRDAGAAMRLLPANAARANGGTRGWRWGLHYPVVWCRSPSTKSGRARPQHDKRPSMHRPPYQSIGSRDHISPGGAPNSTGPPGVSPQYQRIFCHRESPAFHLRIAPRSRCTVGFSSSRTLASALILPLIL